MGDVEWISWQAARARSVRLILCPSYWQPWWSRCYQWVASLSHTRKRYANEQGGILEIGAFHSLRQENLKAYWQYNSQLQPFYTNLSTIIHPSPNRPITLGLHLLALLADGKLTEFHTLLETLDKSLLDDVFVRLPVDMDRWLMEGSYLKIYRAKDRVPREEFQYLLQRLWSTMRWVWLIYEELKLMVDHKSPRLFKRHTSPFLFSPPHDSSTLTKTRTRPSNLPKR